MLDGATGEVVLKDGTRLGRELTLDAFVWTSPLHKVARRGEGAEAAFDRSDEDVLLERLLDEIDRSSLHRPD